MPTQSEIITQLSAMAEPEYAAFASRLIPGCPQAGGGSSPLGPFPPASLPFRTERLLSL